MERYLSELARELERREVPNREEIVEKYRKRYMFGLESDLSQAEIEQMLGDPGEVADKFCSYSTNTKEDDSTQSSKLRNFKVSTNCDDIEIIRDNVSSISSKFVDCKPEDYFIKDNSEEIAIDVKKKTFGFFSKSSGKIIITIPYEMTFNKVSFTTVSGNMKLGSFSGNKLDINVVSGDASFDTISAFETKFQMVSGDVTGKFVDCNVLKIHSVSGDVEVKEVRGYNISCESISGDVIIDKSNCKVSSTSITGEIKIKKGEF